MNKEKDDLNEKSPQVPNRDFRRARRGIEEGEASYEFEERG